MLKALIISYISDNLVYPLFSHLWALTIYFSKVNEPPTLTFTRLLLLFLRHTQRVNLRVLLCSVYVRLLHAATGARPTSPRDTEESRPAGLTHRPSPGPEKRCAYPHHSSPLKREWELPALVFRYLTATYGPQKLLSTEWNERPITHSQYELVCE
jgi:hypothetical protein